MMLVSYQRGAGHEEKRRASGGESVESSVAVASAELGHPAWDAICAASHPIDKFKAGV